MNKIIWKALICDDDEYMRKAVRVLLDEHPSFQVAGEAATGSELLEKHCRLKVHVLFLDIKLPDMEGTEVARSIRLIDEDVKIVFFTAFSDHMQEAFQVYADDYLVKPVNKERIFQTLKRINRTLWEKYHVQRLMLSRKKGKVFVDLDSIILIEVTRRKVAVITENGQYSCTSSLRRMEERLPGYFQRINKNQVIDIRRVCKVEACLEGKYYLITLKGYDGSLEVTPTYCKDFMNSMSSLGL